jgi:serine protease Do
VKTLRLLAVLVLIAAALYASGAVHVQVDFAMPGRGTAPEAAPAFWQESPKEPFLAPAAQIAVRFADASEHPARLVGADPKTDIALLKTEATGLPVIPFGDSDRLEAGEPVMAIGNPFGLDQTVTTGIVSAKERFIGGGPYDDFIQTDASVNPGNSGGPLLDARYLGVSVGPVSPQVAKALGLGGRFGAVVGEVAPRSPAALAGLQPGDVIVGYQDAPIEAPQELTRRVAATAPGTRVTLSVVTPNGRRPFTTTLVELKDRR